MPSTNCGPRQLNADPPFTWCPLRVNLFRDIRCPLLAQSGHGLVHRTCPLSGVERTHLPPGGYVTLAGFILAQLHELPKPGDHLSWAGWRFEVVDMDGRRIDMILAQRHLER